MSKTRATIFLACLCTLALASACNSLHPKEARVERIWPPGDDDSDTDTAARSQASKSSARRASVTKSTDQSNSLGPPTLHLDGSTDVHPGHVPVSDERLTPDQHQQLLEQLQSMSRLTNNDQSSAAPAEPSNSKQKARQENALASYISDKPAESSDPRAQPGPSPTANSQPAATEPATAQPEINPPASTPSATTQPTTAPAAAATTSGTQAAPASQPSTAANAATAPADSSAQPTRVVADSETPSAPPVNPATTSASESPSTDNTSQSEVSAESSNKNWQTELHHAVEALERQLADESLSQDERIRLEATLRLLYVAENRREDAAKPISALDTDQQEFWKFSLAGWFEMLDTDGSPVASRRSKLALRHFRDAIFHLAAASSLEVRNLAICERVDSFGCYTEFDPYEFTPEQEVILYVEVGNFAAEPKDGGYETELQGSYQILDNSGRSVADTDLMLDKQICRGMRTDYFLPYRVFLPKGLAPGQYRIQVTIEDKKGKKFGQSPPVEFRVKQ